MPRDSEDNLGGTLHGAGRSRKLCSILCKSVESGTDSLVPERARIDNYYDIKCLRWKTWIQTLARASLNMSTVLESILEEM